MSVPVPDVAVYTSRHQAASVPTMSKNPFPGEPAGTGYVPEKELVGRVFQFPAFNTVPSGAWE